MLRVILKEQIGVVRRGDVPSCLFVTKLTGKVSTFVEDGVPLLLGIDWHGDHHRQVIFVPLLGVILLRLGVAI